MYDMKRYGRMYYLSFSLILFFCPVARDVDVPCGCRSSDIGGVEWWSSEVGWTMARVQEIEPWQLWGSRLSGSSKRL